MSPKAEGSGDEGMDVDLDNFMTLDSVGDVDGKLCLMNSFEMSIL